MPLFQKFCPAEEMESLAPGYFLLDGVLVRKWVPQSDTIIGDAIFQIVVPTKLRVEVLKTAHDTLAGHIGVRKTYDKVLCYFYWPRLKKDIAAYVSGFKRRLHEAVQSAKTNIGKA